MAKLSDLQGSVYAIAYEFALLTALYGDEKRVAAFNRRHGRFFHWLRGAIVERLFVGIARVLDRRGTRAEPNASFEAVICGARIDESVKRQLMNDLATIRSEADTMLQHRHKRIAHADRNIADGTRELPPVTLGELREIKNRIVELFGRISIATGGPACEVDASAGLQDGESLAETVKAGTMARAKAFGTGFRAHLRPSKPRRK